MAYLPLVYISDTDPSKNYNQFQVRSVTIPVTQSGWNEVDFSFEYPIELYAAWPAGFKVGDEGETILAPDTVIGVLAQGASAGATECVLNDGVNAKVGRRLKIGSQDCGWIKTRTGNTITFSAALGQDEAAGAYAKISIYLLRDFKCFADWVPDLGNSKIGGTYIPAGTVIRFRYKANSFLTSFEAGTYLEYMVCDT
jgi:hypothetical protein